MPTDVLEPFQARVGSTLKDKWTLERLLGVGGMAAVYAARHRVGTPVAIKIMHPELSRSTELRLRFEREAEVMAKLDHPATVEVRDMDVTDAGEPFLVMELLEGESLKDRFVGDQALSLEELLRVMDEVLDVLAAAHALGIIHRDIKPDNIYLLPDGRVKVLDFGVARVDDGVPMTMVGTRLGTLPYMPPEQVLGHDTDGRADLFAVGAVLFRLVANRRIHEAKTESEMVLAMSMRPAPALASVAPQAPKELCLLVDRALAFEREDRYPDAATMLDDLRALREGEAPPYAAAQATSGATEEGKAAPMSDTAYATPFLEGTAVTKVGGVGRVAQADEADEAEDEAESGARHTVPVAEPTKLSAGSRAPADPTVVSSGLPSRTEEVMPPPEAPARGGTQILAPQVSYPVGQAYAGGVPSATSGAPPQMGAALGATTGATVGAAVVATPDGPDRTVIAIVAVLGGLLVLATLVGLAWWATSERAEETATSEPTEIAPPPRELGDDESGFIPINPTDEPPLPGAKPAPPPAVKTPIGVTPKPVPVPPTFVPPGQTKKKKKKR